MTMATATNLILVDGLPGAGKSTTAQFLALQFQRQQIPACWFYELDHNHPIHAFHVWSRKGPECFIGTTLQNWTTFVQANARTDQINILESTFFQSSVRLLLQSDLPSARIREYALRVAAIIDPLHPVFIYMPSADVAAALQEICEYRKKTWEQYFIQIIDSSRYAKARKLRGFDGVVAFFEEYQRLTNNLYAELTMRKMMCENAKRQWPEFRRQLCRFFDIRDLADPVLSADAARRYVGRYRADGTRLELRVYANQQQLVVCDLLWPKSRLIPRTRNSFDVEACTIAITFNEDAERVIRSMTIGGSRGWKFYGRTLTKIDENTGELCTR